MVRPRIKFKRPRHGGELFQYVVGLRLWSQDAGRTWSMVEPEMPPETTVLTVVKIDYRNGSVTLA